MGIPPMNVSSSGLNSRYSSSEASLIGTLKVGTEQEEKTEALLARDETRGYPPSKAFLDNFYKDTHLNYKESLTQLGALRMHDGGHALPWSARSFLLIRIQYYVLVQILPKTITHNFISIITTRNLSSAYESFLRFNKSGKQRQRKKAANFRRRQGKNTPANPSSFPYSSASGFSLSLRCWGAQQTPSSAGACGGPLTLARLSLPPRPVFSGVGLPHCDAGSEQGGNKAVMASSKSSTISTIEQLKTSTGDRTYISYHGSVDTPTDGVDTGHQSLKQIHENRVHCVDTVPGSVDTRPSLQKTHLPDWDSVSTQPVSVLTLEPSPRTSFCANWDGVSTHSGTVSTHSS
ncbi:hypothetical protein Taro_019751 [Colocasia esculenta]|uniref:Uncharacterized protein n=1 Tax=Colocasia esculenta TaxID=4460 RepID=A0A843UX38_COLES|nr:hypothetical protein [Colocasia esculenta]